MAAAWVFCRSPRTSQVLLASGPVLQLVIFQPALCQKHCRPAPATFWQCPCKSVLCPLWSIALRWLVRSSIQARWTSGELRGLGLDCKYCVHGMCGSLSRIRCRIRPSFSNRVPRLSVILVLLQIQPTTIQVFLDCPRPTQSLIVLDHQYLVFALLLTWCLSSQRTLRCNAPSSPQPWFSFPCDGCCMGILWMAASSVSWKGGTKKHHPSEHFRVTGTCIWDSLGSSSTGSHVGTLLA